MHKFDDFESESVADLGNIKFAFYTKLPPARASFDLRNSTWLRLKCNDDLRYDVRHVALKLGGETLLQLSKQLVGEHHFYRKYFIGHIEYRQKTGVKVHQHGEPLPTLILEYRDYVLRYVLNVQRQLTALCGSEILVNFAQPGCVKIYERALILEDAET